jgi:hypothetical protein
MATSPTTTEQHEQHEHQETMFEDSTGFPDTYSEEASFEASEDTSEEIADEASGEMHGETVHQTNHDMHANESEQPSSQATPASTSSAAVGPEADAESDSLSLTVFSVDDFAALEERVLKAVSLVRRERQGHAAAEERARALEAQLLQLEAKVQSQVPAITKLQQEIDSLRVEREQVRQRVDRLLSQLDALEL